MKVIERDLAAAPLPPVALDYARAITSSMPDKAQFSVSEQLIGEIETTDALIINTPMHNFTVPAALKLWIDYKLRIHRTFASTPEGQGWTNARPADHRDRRFGRCPSRRTSAAAGFPDAVSALSARLDRHLQREVSSPARACDRRRGGGRGARCGARPTSGDAVFASLAAQAAGSASMAAGTAGQSA